MNSVWNKNDPANNIWRTRDVTEMSTVLNTAPIFIDEVKSNSNDSLSFFSAACLEIIVYENNVIELSDV